MKQILVVILLCCLVGMGSAQEAAFNVEDYKVLTPDNISQLKHIAYIGTGSWATPMWLADNKTLFINTSTGQWRYDVTQMDQPPTFAPYPPLYSYPNDFVTNLDGIDLKSIAVSPDRQYAVELVQGELPDFFISNEYKSTLIVKKHGTEVEIARLTSDAIGGHRTLMSLLTLPKFGILGLTYLRDNDLYRWSPETKQEILILTSTQLAGGELVFSPDGRYLATFRLGGADNSPVLVRFWALTTDSPVMLFEKEFPSYTTGYYDNSFSVDFSPDSKTLISGRSGENVRIWDLATFGLTYQDTREETWDYETQQVAYSPDGRYIGGCQVLFGGGYAFLRDVTTGENVGIVDGFPGDGTFSCQDVFFHPTQPDFLILNPFGTLESWPIDELIARQSVVIDEAPLIFGDPIVERRERPVAAALNGSGTVVALTYEDGLVHLLGYDTGREIAVLENSSRVLSLVFNPGDDNRLITGDIAGDVKAWDLTTQTPQTLINIPGVPAAYEQNPQAFYLNWDQFPLLMNAEGTLLAAYDGLYLPQKGISADQIVVKSIMPKAFSPDGRFIATVENGDISLWGVPKED